MLAAFYVRTGPAREVLIVDELNTPLPGPGEVRVRIHASGINPADVKRRAGESVRPLQFPMIIPHSDGAGIIDMTGGGVSHRREGERVWLWNTQWRRPFGTAAEYAVVPSEQAVTLPDSANFAFGATLGVPALTAHRCISVLGGRLRKEHILIFGGSGMVGRFAIQFAKSRGAIVTTTASSDAKAEAARLAGADYVVNYRTDDLVESARQITNSALFSYILDIDFAANSQLYTRLLKRCGAVVVFGSASEMEPRLSVLALQTHGVSLHMISGSDQPAYVRAAAIVQIRDLLAQGKLTARIERSYGLQSIAEAHECVEAGSLGGKVIIEP